MKSFLKATKSYNSLNRGYSFNIINEYPDPNLQPRKKTKKKNRSSFSNK